jgi:hypothetical protein
MMCPKIDAQSWMISFAQIHRHMYDATHLISLMMDHQSIMAVIAITTATTSMATVTPIANH